MRISIACAIHQDPACRPAVFSNQPQFSVAYFNAYCRPRACPTAGFSSLFVGRRPILTDLEVGPTLVERRPGSTADESGIDGGDGVGPFVTAPSEKKLYHGVATRANRQTHRIAVQQVLEPEIAARDRYFACVH